MDRSGMVLHYRMPNGVPPSIPSPATEGVCEPVPIPTTAEPKPLPRIHAMPSGNGTQHHHTVDEPPKSKKVRYRECQKNHAANMGGHAVDGCGEFLPSGKEGTLEALKCAACSCHRNFHRREVEGEHSCSCKSKQQAVISGPSTPSLLTLPSSSHPQMVMPLNSPLLTQSDDPYMHAGSRKKRFRTKFTNEQKQKMSYFAETVGWKISKQDEDAVQEFCNDIGVNRNVFKVWMHNNKNNFTKKLNNEAEHAGKYDSSPEY